MLKLLFFAFALLFGGFQTAHAEAVNHLVISEVRIGGESAYDEYVELYNPTSNPISIEGFKLTKKAASGTEYTLVSAFSAQTIVPDGYLLISHPESGYEGLHYSTKNSMASNNTVVLYNKEKVVADKVGFGKVVDFEGQPFPDLQKNQILIRKDNIDTNNNANDFEIKDRPGAGASQNTDTSSQEIKVFINELYPDPLPTESESKDEWIELYNPNEVEADLSGWSLEDKLGSVSKYIIQPITQIAANGYLVFLSADTKLSLNNSGDEVVLRDKTGKEISSSPNYGNAKSGQSFALIDDRWFWTSAVTKGKENVKSESLPSPESEDGNQVAVSSTKKSKTKASSKPKESDPIKSSTAKPAKAKTTKKDQNGAEVLGVTAPKEEFLGQKDSKNQDNLGIIFALAGVVIASGYLAYTNRSELEESLRN
jgi:hypothetical protein